jgi:ribosome-associated protein
MKTIFTIEGDYIELMKLLKACGQFTTGGMAKVAIIEGRVTVDDQVELRRGRKIRKGQVVAFEGHKIEVA